VLFGIPREQLGATLLPVGEFESKAAVREEASRLGLPVFDKPESQEICFVPDNDYAGFLGRRLGEDHPALAEGELVTAAGEVIGRHGGYGRYTVGQRKGLGGGRGAPLYVLGVVPADNRVVVGTSDDLMKDEVELGGLNWIAEPPRPGETVSVQIRHRAREVEARVVDFAEDRLLLRTSRAQRAVTPGQSGAVYRGERLIGGGRIR